LLGKFVEGYFSLEFEKPTSLSSGISYIPAYGRVEAQSNIFDVDCTLE
jgi:hypothetical protein